jgi:hypothetical protein
MLGGPGWRSGRGHMMQRVNPEEYEQWLVGAARELVDYFNGVPDFDDAIRYLRTTWDPVPDADEIAAIVRTASHLESAGTTTLGRRGAEFVEALGGRFAQESESVAPERETFFEAKPKRMSAKAKYEAWINEAAQDAYQWFGRGDHAITGDRLAEYLTSVWKPKPRKSEMRAIADRIGELVRLRIKSIAGPQEQYMFEPGGLYGPETIVPWGKKLFPRGKAKVQRAKKNPSSPKYYVKARGSKEEGLQGWVRGPYELTVAKEYARIGSQEGRDRSVLRGHGGPIVRRYSHGKRTWPTTSSQLKGLLHKEHPREL